jgi:hypothetical protein
MNDDFIRIRLPSELFPVEAFFNSIRSDLYLRTLAAFAEGHGAGFDEAGVMFPADDPSIPENHVLFYLFEDDVTISCRDFLKILGQYNQEFLARDPNRSQEALSLIKTLEERCASF